MSTDQAIEILRASATPWNLPAFLAHAFITAKQGPEDARIVGIIVSATLSAKEGTKNE